MSNATVMIGQTLDRYRIVSKLGEGGMGVVYKARDEHLNRTVAVKVLPADRVADPARKERFVREARAGRNGPNGVCVVAGQRGWAGPGPGWLAELLVGGGSRCCVARRPRSADRRRLRHRSDCGRTRLLVRRRHAHQLLRAGR